MFIIALDYALREVTREPQVGSTLTTRLPTTYITDTDFADDIALLSNHLEQGQLLLLRLEVETDTVGLNLNNKKTEYMLCNQPDKRKKNNIKQIHNFKYLCAWIQYCWDKIWK